LKGLLGEGTPKGFEVSNILLLGKILNFGIVKDVRGRIKDERVCSYSI
jgi:hypothetical protein